MYSYLSIVIVGRIPHISFLLSFVSIIMVLCISVACDQCVFESRSQFIIQLCIFLNILHAPDICYLNFSCLYFLRVGPQQYFCFICGYFQSYDTAPLNYFIDNFSVLYNMLILQASSKLGLLRRTCHFTSDIRQKRSFYLATVRSLFEHCSTVWSPQYASHLSKFEAIQRRAVKWINGEPFCSYSDDKYAEELRKLKILPMKLKFMYNDLVLFYKIVNKLVPVELPDHIRICNAEGTRLTRRTADIHDLTDISTYQCNISPSTDALRNSFFFRTMLNWNSLPMSIRQREGLTLFKSSLTSHLWSPDVEWPD